MSATTLQPAERKDRVCYDHHTKSEKGKSMAAPRKSGRAHRQFRRFLARSGEKNVFRAFLQWQKSLDEERTYRWWAERWQMDYSLLALWAAPWDNPRRQYRRIGPHFRQVVFADLGALAGITMDEYYLSAPPSNQPKAAKRAAQRGSKSVARKRSRKP